MSGATGDQSRALQLARSLVALGYDTERILASEFIAPGLREFVAAELEREANFPLVPARTIVASGGNPDWLRDLDRSRWYYWPTLRQYLLTTKAWNSAAVRSLDNSSDKILRLLRPPTDQRFDTRGLVLGFVQSGKTASYTAVIAKAADAGYRLVVVLSGIDNGLRRQTNLRLKRELVGYADNRATAVPLPPLGWQWHEFTRPELNGDFQPGFANHAALQGSQPVLLVVKKNGPVLRRLLSWLDEAPVEVRRHLPMLVVDDESDQASVDTRGSYQTDEESDELPSDYEPPSVINGLIRGLLDRFERRAYIAYTATPFANILVPHDTQDPSVGNDLFPKDFIVDLPKPIGYFGAEDIFGRLDLASGEDQSGIDCIRAVEDSDIAALRQAVMPESLTLAITDFVLGGAARLRRCEDRDVPLTMLIHTSQLILEQAHLSTAVSDHFAELRDEWRYQRKHGIKERLRDRWESEFRPVTRAKHAGLDVRFEEIEPQVGRLLEATQVREVNSATGEGLDYEREPALKAIVIGGNRLSRGLTLEGLLVSYFIRRSATYDTLMQMGRWFGFREGYEDLTRIYTTPELAGWFHDLALVEYRLREDIRVYEDQGLTPMQVGMRIWKHPSMQVTSRLKRRFATDTVIAQTFGLSLEQTFKFPLSRPHDLAFQADSNLVATRQLRDTLGAPDASASDSKGPVWTGVPAARVIQYLRHYKVDEATRSISLPLIIEYIERSVEQGELTTWTVAFRGRATRDATLGIADWGGPAATLAQVSRSRLRGLDSLGVIVDPEDEAVGIPTALRGKEARAMRSPQEGLLILYPISRYSGYDLKPGANRRPLYDNPRHLLARDLVGLAISFPTSRQVATVEAYLQGTVAWAPLDDSNRS